MALDLSKCYRAKVKDNNYKGSAGRKAGAAPGSVLVNSEDWNADTGRPAEVWAFPLNGAFLGSDTGRVQNAGQCIIPPVGSDVWVAWEDNVKDANNGALAWYFGSCGFDNSKTIPKETASRGEPQNTYTLFRSPQGRSIIVSDDKDGSGIIIKCKNDGNGKLSTGSDMAIVLNENSDNSITIQSGNGKQYIVVNKDDNITVINQGNSRIYMDDSNINIVTSSTINLKAGKINLNC